MQENLNILQELSELILQIFTTQTGRTEEEGGGHSHLSTEKFTERLRQPELFDAGKAFQQFDRNYLLRKRRLRILWQWSVAVGIVLVVGAGFIFYNPVLIPETPITVGRKLQPGKLQPLVILADGERVILSDSSMVLKEKNGSVILQDSGRLTYSPSVSNETLLYNTVTVPRGNELLLYLSDGTKVWLNADSELRYPTFFSGERREVWLVGEAYFEVVADSSQPFWVYSAKGKIEVLGTSFNVRSYPEEARIVTTLVKGSIVYTDSEQHKFELSPGEQTISQPGLATILQKVNPDYYTGWKDGKYVFKSTTLEDIMQELSRWYNITVFYANTEVKQLHFTGDLKRYDRVETFLRFLEIGGDVCFDVKGNTVTVRKK